MKRGQRGGARLSSGSSGDEITRHLSSQTFSGANTISYKRGSSSFVKRFVPGPWGGGRGRGGGRSGVVGPQGREGGVNGRCYCCVRAAGCEGYYARIRNPVLLTLSLT